MPHDLDYYLAVPYMLAVESIEKPDGDWVRRAEYPELPDCYAEAFAAVDAIEKVEERRVQRIKEMLERGEEVPVPRPPLISSEPELDRDRLGFARWLVDEKKISDTWLTARNGQAFVRALLEPRPPNQALRDAAAHYRRVMHSG